MKRALFAFILFTMTLPAFAAEPVSAIAMHGTPKYAGGFTHLSYANPDAPQGGTLTQCATGTFDTLNGNNIKGKPAQGLHLINDQLMQRVWGEPFSLYGLVAEKVIVPEDRSSITFILNPKARFHDGTPITTDDVAFSYETLKTYGKPNTRVVYGLVETVDTIDKQTIRFNFSDDADRETPMILALMPVLPKHYWADKEFDSTTLNTPLGSGPYKISAIDPGKKITFEKVDDYWANDLPVNRGHYNFDRMVFDYYRDEQVAIEAFKAKECDIRREFNPARWETDYTNDQGYIPESLSHSRPEWARGFIFNLRRPPMDDIRVREALSLALDFDWMNRTLFHGKAKPITSTFPNSVLAATNEQDVSDLRTRLRQADTLLKDAGWNVANGKRVKNNQPLELTLILNNPDEEKIALAYTNTLRRLGVTLKIRTLDTAQFFGALNAYDYDMVSYRWINSLSPGTEQMVYWGCEAAKTEGSRNYAGICDQDIDNAATATAQAVTYDDLIEKAHTLDRLLMAQHLFVPLYYIGQDYVARWPQIRHPETQSLYGMVLETWWHQTQ